MKTCSKEFTFSFDFKWIHLLPENSSDFEKKNNLISYALEVGLAISLKLQIKLESWSYKAKQNKRKKCVKFCETNYVNFAQLYSGHNCKWKDQTN